MNFYKLNLGFSSNDSVQDSWNNLNAQDIFNNDLYFIKSSLTGFKFAIHKNDTFYD
jgi:hypothetical protein